MRPILSAVLGLLVAACTQASTVEQPPTVEQALAHVSAIVEYVQAGDVSHICDFGGTSCPASVDRLDPRAVPTTRPVILGVVVRPRVELGDGTSSKPYVRVELCGLDGLGRPYHTRLGIFRDRGRIVAVEPAYWLGIGIADDPVVGAPEPPVPCPGVGGFMTEPPG